jgi:hypothetical protein
MKNLLVKDPSRRGEGGVQWSGGPLWSPAVPYRMEIRLSGVWQQLMGRSFEHRIV